MRAAECVDVERGTIIGHVRRRATATPDSVAVTDAAESVSYAELWRRAEAVARLLRAHGGEPGRPVGLCMSPTVGRLAAMLATMGVGVAYLPIDPNFPDGRIRSIIDSAGADRVIVDDVTGKRFASLPYALIDASAVPATVPAEGPALIDASAVPATVSAEGSALIDASAAPAAVGPALIEPDTADLAYVISTSGSTGQPKAVAIEHGGVENLLDALDRVLPPPTAGQCWLAAANVCFDLSVAELFWPLTRGVPVVVAALEALAGRADQDVDFLTEVLAGGGITHLFVTPSLVQLMLRDPVLAAGVRRLDVLILGGEIVRPELVARLRSVAHLYNGYGPTEATVLTTVHECSDSDRDEVPIGPPLHGLEVRVVDETGAACPAGVPGELWIAGPGVARGYLNDAELTARKFVWAGDGANRRRWYRTGDLAIIGEDSIVRYRGRIDGQVKVRGFRIEAGEVEAAIRAVPGVEEAVVLPIRGEGATVTGLTAVVKAAPGDVTEAGIIDEVSAVLPWYAVPRAVKIVANLPLSLTGKVDRKALEQQLVPVAEPQVPVRHLRGGNVERIVAGIWGEVLDADRAIDAEAGFFEIGGDSARLVAVYTRLRDAFPAAELRLVDMYRTPTIAGLAARVSAGPSVTVEPATASSADVAPEHAARRSAADRRRLARRVK